MRAMAAVSTRRESGGMTGKSEVGGASVGAVSNWESTSRSSSVRRPEKAALKIRALAASHRQKPAIQSGEWDRKRNGSNLGMNPRCPLESINASREGGGNQREAGGMRRESEARSHKEATSFTRHLPLATWRTVFTVQHSALQPSLSPNKKILKR